MILTNYVESHELLVYKDCWLFVGDLKGKRKMCEPCGESEEDSTAGEGGRSCRKCGTDFKQLVEDSSHKDEGNKAIKIFRKLSTSLLKRVNCLNYRQKKP